ncbi:MAG TPA: sigma-70 family RNA polymerase sigma factor [Allosphingosinicella sp.]|nr:sigma-70 family RNA polymerase sigma factor [Allosphingosinicella sp.]
MARDRERILDAYLVASARLGDREALGALARRWNGKFIAHAWRLLRDREGAKDAVQESWAEIMRGLSCLRDDGAFAAWAYRIVSRRCARHIGRIQGERRLAEEVAAPPAKDGLSEPSSLDVEAARAAIRTLPAGQQAAIALFYLEDMSVAEVAVALDVPAGTVKTRLMHARRKLRSALEGDE